MEAHPWWTPALISLVSERGDPGEARRCRELDAAGWYTPGMPVNSPMNQSSVEETVSRKSFTIGRLMLTLQEGNLDSISHPQPL